MMPLVEMMGITFFRPIFVSIPAILFLGEIAHDRRWITIPAGFGAELIIVRPGIQVLNWGRWLS